MTAALLLVLLLSLPLASLLLLLQRKLSLPCNQDQQQLLDLLPGINCGLCGYPGCKPYANALASGKEKDVLRCTPGGKDLPAQLAQQLQLPPPGPAPPAQVAVVKCVGGDLQVRKNHLYLGPADCQAEFLLLDGEKSCRYSCLGRGSCVKVCPTAAISITAQKLAVVDAAACIGCELCIDACPTGVIGMIPATQSYFVGCNSIEHGKTVREKCQIGCIGCRICQQRHGLLGFLVEHNLAAVAQPATDAAPDLIKKAISDCPTGCITACSNSLGAAKHTLIPQKMIQSPPKSILSTKRESVADNGKDSIVVRPAAASPEGGLL